MLSKVGGFDIAGMCGIFLGGAVYRVPVLIDGLISAVAALCAVRMCPDAAKAALASHVSAEPAGRLILDKLGKKPLITAEMRLGEGTGAVAAMPLLEMALVLSRAGTTLGGARRGAVLHPVSRRQRHDGPADGHPLRRAVPACARCARRAYSVRRSGAVGAAGLPQD